MKEFVAIWTWKNNQMPHASDGGPGTGNGVVGGAVALVLGLIALSLGGLALGRCRRTALEAGRMM